MRKEQEEAALQAVIDGLREATQDLRNQLEDKQAELAEAERSVSGLSTEKETIEMSKTLLMNRVQTARERVSSLEQKLVMVSEEKTKAEEKIIERRNETKKLKKEETNLTSAVENTITQESQLEAGYSIVSSSKQTNIKIVIIIQSYIRFFMID
jgi:chromosome segregation ATPase